MNNSQPLALESLTGLNVLAIKPLKTWRRATDHSDDAKDASLAITSDSPGCSELPTFNVAEQDNTPSEISLALSDSSDSEFSFSPRGSVNRDQEMELSMEESPTTRCIKGGPVGLVRSGIKRDGAQLRQRVEILVNRLLRHQKAQSPEASRFDPG